MTTAVSLHTLRSDVGRRNPYPCYAQLHEHGQVSLLDFEADRYDAVIYGYEAVDQVLRDPRFKATDAERLDLLRPEWREHPSLLTLVTSMFFTNGPAHARVRRLFSQVFTARRVAELEAPVVRLTAELLDRMEDLGRGGAEVELMAEFAFPLPSNVIGELLGVPEPDRAWFRPRVIAIGKVLELGGSTPENLARADAAAVELTRYFDELAAKRRADPRDDLISGLVSVAEGSPEKLESAELLANLITLFNAGFVTTTHLLANGLTLLLEHPDELAVMRAGQAVSTVEEILRFEPPTHFVVRYTAADVEVDGVLVPAGSSVLVLLGAADRDPRKFPDPDTFRAGRADGPPITFGAGIHFCLGAPLSRLEGQIALPMLLERFPDISVAREPGERTQLMLRGYDTLYVRVG